MRRTLSQCLAAVAVLSLALAAPAGAKPVKDGMKADPAVLKQVQRAYAVFRTPKAKTDVITGLRGVPKAQRRRLAHTHSRFLANVGGVKFYGLLTGKQFMSLSVPVVDGFVGAGGRFALGPFDPLSELRQAVRVPERYVVREVVRAVIVVDGTTNAVRRDADGRTTPLRIFRNLVADVSDGTGTIEWTRPDGTVAAFPPVAAPALTPQP